jgi:uncharacterized protein YciI
MSDGSDAPFELDRFELVLLRRPTSPVSLDDDEIDLVQQRHLDFLGEMHAAEHLVVAGPFDEQHDEKLRGLCLYATGSIDETRALAAGDPAVVAGRLEVDVMYVYLKKGAIPIPWSDR